MDSVFLATLGAEPQVISLATEQLLAQAVPLRAVVAAARRERARIGPGLVPLPQGRNQSDAEAPWQTVPGEVAEFKRRGCPLHRCITAGRRLIGLLVVAAATLWCDRKERLWHIYAAR